jgi:hypothetical protein
MASCLLSLPCKHLSLGQVHSQRKGIIMAKLPRRTRERYYHVEWHAGDQFPRDHIVHRVSDPGSDIITRLNNTLSIIPNLSIHFLFHWDPERETAKSVARLILKHSEKLDALGLTSSSHMGMPDRYRTLITLDFNSADLDSKEVTKLLLQVCAVIGLPKPICMTVHHAYEVRVRTKDGYQWIIEGRHLLEEASC